MKTIICEKLIHYGEERVSLRFPYDTKLISITRSIEGAKWSKTMYCWHIPDNEKVIESLTRLFDGKALIDYSAIKPVSPLNTRITGPEELKEKNLKTGTTVDNNFSLLSDKGKTDTARFRKWLEVNRYPESTIRTYTC